jgi:alkanesulfonate monooxygenase
MTSKASIEVFSTCPYSSAVEKDRFMSNVVDVARWSEQAGCRGILVYTDNSTVDPWLASQIIIQSTEALCPLVAVQPVYMHPYSVAKMVASLGHMYGRRIYLNMVAGGFKNDLAALNDTIPHDRRYDRLIEYTAVIKELLASPHAVSYEGEFYKVDKLKMTPYLSPDLSPGIFVSGSSEAGLVAARSIGAVAIKYPKPVDEYEGVVADEADESWRVAYERFPEDRRGQIAHQLAMKVSDSTWHKQLSEMWEEAETQDSPYWLTPFKNYRTFCPYLVGSYSRVAEELTRYIAVGYETFILDIPPNEEELHHIGVVFDLASKAAGVKLASKGAAHGAGETIP